MVAAGRRAHERRTHALRPAQLLEAERGRVELGSGIGVADEQDGVVEAGDGHDANPIARGFQADVQLHPLAALRPMFSHAMPSR